MDPAIPIKLDYTLRDLYSNGNEDDLNTVLIYYPLQFEYIHGRSSTKFVYAYTLQNDDEKASSSIAMAAGMLPQRYAFSAGNMPLFILDFDPRNIQKEANHITCQVMDKLPPRHVDIRRTFAQLTPDQQPTLTFVDNPENIPLEAGAQVAVLVPIDCLSHLPHLVQPEIHYEILSKRGLAVSGLATPPSQVIDTCLIDPGDPILLKQEVSRMVESTEQRQLPFMIKLPQSISGIAAQQVQSSLISLFYGTSRLHYWASGGAVAFRHEKGQPRFIACCEQLFDEQGHWIGGSILYRQQTELCETFSAISENVATFLHSKGYHGPAGVDIVTDEHSGEQFIVDLNVRVTGTFHLGPLLGHFTQRGLFEAAITMGDFSCSRDAFEERFADEIRNGSLIVSGWVHDESSRPSHAAITIGARDSYELKEYLERIKAVALHA
ncbi:hypothetical protein N7516_010069 [Penicillium verrucosum]|uniref:uncharacterized protein n=1 Tax=Penicillium verrucosum TaxID=60171 RepID=UPI002545598F|nr:uncharacterized protein N7516_010069 [Penicillium verrucosum]KAJ5922366.1 hypothetical protein N7516_010069 [Penicillium verrucosum]